MAARPHTPHTPHAAHTRTASDSSFGEFATAPTPTPVGATFPPMPEPAPLLSSAPPGAAGREDPGVSGFSDFVAAPTRASPAPRPAAGEEEDPGWGSFEMAMPVPPAPPSPPIRDLRPVEARLRLHERNGAADPDPTDPSTMAYSSSGLRGEQLASNTNAQTSILPIPPAHVPLHQAEQPAANSLSPKGSGGLWRTFTSLNLRQIGGQARGAAGEALSHFPRPHLPSGLFNVAADDPEFQAYQQTLPSSGLSSASPSPSPSPVPFRTPIATSSSSRPKATPIISGAPGFSVAQDRFENQNWNRAGWSMPLDASPSAVGSTVPTSATSPNDASHVQSQSSQPSKSSVKQTPKNPLERVRVLTGATAHAAAESRFARRRAQAVTLRGRYSDTREVVRPRLAAQLQGVLPARLQLGRGWRLVYSTDQHGISLQTLYDRVGRSMVQSSTMRSAAREGWLRGASSATASAVTGEEAGSSALSTSATLGEAANAATQATDKMARSGLAMHDAGLILAVQDSDGNVFGAFLNEPIRPHPHYFGSGQSFLWKTVKVPGLRNDHDGILEAGRMLKVFPWSGSNMYACLAQSSSLAFGGGPDGRYGLWLDEQLENGVTDMSVTFGNDPLADTAAFPASNGKERKEQKFECIALEVWAVGVD